MKPLVYIAGPYATPDPVLNTRRAIAVADHLVAAGAAVIVPHLTMLWHLVSPRPVEDWYAIDLDVLAHCDLVVRFTGESTGADNEVAHAQRLGIDVLNLRDLRLNDRGAGDAFKVWWLNQQDPAPMARQVICPGCDSYVDVPDAPTRPAHE